MIDRIDPPRRWIEDGTSEEGAMDFVMVQAAHNYRMKIGPDDWVRQIVEIPCHKQNLFAILGISHSEMS
jgi:hypothetical protein